MASIAEHLKRWRDAGLLDGDTVARIEAFETAQRAGKKETERPGALEALLYLGVIVLGVGVYALVAQQWDQMESWARVLATSVPVAILLVAGAAMRATGDPPMERAGQAAWLVSVGLFAGALAVVINEYGPDSRSGADDRSAMLMVATLTFGLALALWVLSPSHAQVVALAGSAVFLGQMVGNWPDEFSEPLAGFLLLAFGAGGVVLGELGLLAPRASVRFLFAAMAIAGPYEAGFGDKVEMAYELLTFAAAAGVIALGVWRGSFSLVVVGVLGTFVALVTFISEHFEDQVGGPVVLMLSGGALVAAVLAIAAFRRGSQQGKLA